MARNERREELSGLLNVVRGPRLAVGLLYARGQKNEKGDGSEKSDLLSVKPPLSAPCFPYR